MPGEDPSARAEGTDRGGEKKDDTAGRLQSGLLNPPLRGAGTTHKATVICPNLVKEKIYIRFTVRPCPQRVQGASNTRILYPFAIPR